MTINEDPIIETSPQEKVQALMMKFIQRRKNIQPNKADGFLSTNTIADSESSGDGSLASSIGS